MATLQRVVFTRLVPRAVEHLRGLGYAVDSWPKEDVACPREDLLELVRGAHGIVCFLSDKIDAEIIDAAGDELKVISTFSVGYDHVDVKHCHEKGIRVGHTPGVLSNASAELTIGLMLSTMRRLPSAVRSAQEGGWGTWELFGYCGDEVRGRTVGIYGLGGIGSAVAKILAGGFDCKILYGGPREKPEVAATIPGGAEYVDLDRLLAESDIVSAHCPATPDTIGLFNKENFAKMKSTAYFFNTTRGAVVNQDDLVEALTTGVIAGAGLDVTSPEPLPTDHPLFSLPNCVVLPHICSATFETRNAITDLGMENVHAALSGTDMPHQVKP